MYRSKILMIEDPKYKNGFKFDHVFNTMKFFVDSGNINQRHNNNWTSSQSDASVPDSSIFSSPGISQFTINLTNENDGGSPSQMQLEGVKKDKLKRKK
ncbi:hypothetical protein ACS0TY_033579 [Phlomoides rotata]